MTVKKQSATASGASDLPRLSAPARRALASAGLTTLAQVARCTDSELLALHGMGPNALATLRAALAAQAPFASKSSRKLRVPSA